MIVKPWSKVWALAVCSLRPAEAARMRSSARSTRFQPEETTTSTDLGSSRKMCWGSSTLADSALGRG